MSRAISRLPVRMKSKWVPLIKRIKMALIRISEMGWPASRSLRIDGYHIYFSTEYSKHHRNGVGINIKSGNSTNKAQHSELFYRSNIIFLFPEQKFLLTYLTSLLFLLKWKFFIEKSLLICNLKSKQLPTSLGIWFSSECQPFFEKGKFFYKKNFFW